MGTRCLTTVRDGNKELICLYRQMDGYPEGHGIDLKNAFEGFRITNGISGDPAKTANGVGCLAAQVVAHFKKSDGHYDNGNGLQVGGFYLYAPKTREIGEEFVYMLSVRLDSRKNAKKNPFGEPEGKIWLELYEGEVAFFGLPGTKPALMEFLYSGWLDDFDPKKLGQMYHENATE